MTSIPRAYRVLAESSSGDTHLIVTESRLRALRYFELLSTSPGFSEARIELGAKTFTKLTLEQLP